MELFFNRFPLFLDGALTTLLITVLGSLLAFVLAMVVGILGTTRNAAARAVATAYTEAFRGVAALVLLFWFAYAIPQITAYELSPMFAGILALGLNVGAYGAEVVRAAINAVPRAQTEATIALNMSWPRRMWLVLLPQAWAQMLPTFGNLVIELMKASAIVSLINVVDLTHVADELRQTTGETIPAFVSALVMYFIIAQVLIFGMRMLERQANRRLGRAPAGGGLLSLIRPPTPGTKVGAAK
ncbi:ectoine/hydroxyectoine ABC transporter permease subunit EhuC [Streptomonospora wellingtoniae]|uniref:Ectoine/hydroxyectoine ABC transporter permease subunit EhuC n=1 Tax=Streptomonospora wellingtoniae TaxID=3075544 RepID=A0ABU2KYI6_9ACTN|nr:ectoine/hydroxyectoine ABC transporter permease subunit EhuC [Streptomonospora sp. DSM 45055]MDT0304369.1 ectoine/hydroxyectoine ABC transporter permease subunit EhuC [Streptomonospora sp. DSM 45055]